MFPSRPRRQKPLPVFCWLCGTRKPAGFSPNRRKKGFCFITREWGAECSSPLFIFAVRYTAAERLEQKIQDIRTIDRAKCLLIQYSGMSEEQAHRYLEKQAMDRRMTRREVAEEVLRLHNVEQ